MSRLLRGVDLTQLPGLYATERTPTDEKLVVLKFFLAGTRWTWFVVEYDAAEGTFFGFVRSGLGADCDEWAYFDRDELESIGLGPFRIERDLHFHPRPFGQLADWERE